MAYIFRPHGYGLDSKASQPQHVLKGLTLIALTFDLSKVAKNALHKPHNYALDS
jgi:hypothetical protein